MSRDLFPEIESLLSTANPYIRRKAALCAMRICRKVPDLQENFIDKAKATLLDRNHGVLLCGLTLATEFCEVEEEEGGHEIIDQFRPTVPVLIKALKGLTTSGYAPEHDVSGITDPFLQVKILRFLRVLGRGDAATSELMNDILAQVATNTESSKNVGNAILYEAVLTILDIEADSGLRVLGVNILGKFLANKDNNIRYVALNTLIKVVAVEPNAVQRHRNTILECLRDADISIRRRALDLSFTLINEANVRVLVRELLAFLEVADAEFKPAMTTQIGIAADRFAPTRRWHVDTMLRMLKLAGSAVKEQILSSFVRLVATTPELQTYATQKLYAALKEDISQEGLTLAAAWVIGEYGDQLLRGGQYEEEELVRPVRESDPVDLFVNVLNSTYATSAVTEYIVTSLMKLSTRLTEPGQVERIRRLLAARTADLSVEIQQRAVEYTNLFAYDDIRRGVLEKMPAPEIHEEQRVLGEAGVRRPNKTLREKGKKGVGAGAAAAVAKRATGGGSGGDALIDLIGGLDEGPVESPSATPAPAASNTDILADILGPSTSTSTTPAAPSGNLGGLLDDDVPAPAPAPAPTSSAAATQQIYDKNGLTLTFAVKRTNGQAQIVARFVAGGAGDRFGSVGLQVAAPKSQKLTLNPISRSELGGSEEATQAMRLAAVSGVSSLASGWW